VSDPPEVRLTLRGADLSRVVSQTRYELAARGRRDIAALQNGICNKCGENTRLVLAGCVCAVCSAALDKNWMGSTATDWVLVAFRGPEPPKRDGIYTRSSNFSGAWEGLAEGWGTTKEELEEGHGLGVLPFVYLYGDTTYAQMKSQWATCNPPDSLCIGLETVDEFAQYSLNRQSQDPAYRAYYPSTWLEGRPRSGDVVPYLRPATARDLYRPARGERERRAVFAAEQGNGEVQYSLGLYYFGPLCEVTTLCEFTTAEDLCKAAHWYRRAAEQGHAEAQHRLGDMYYAAAESTNIDGTGITTPKNLAIIAATGRTAGLAMPRANEIRAALTAGDLEVTDNYVEAARWFNKAAEQGKAEAQFSLGLMHYHGQGIPQDFAEAVRCFRLAAEQGQRDSQYSLGVMYRDGVGVLQDYTEAVRYFRMAAELWHEGAQFFLGVAIGEGQGQTQDLAEAAGWYRIVARRGNPNKQYFLGEALANGLGAPQDLAEAAVWYRKAAEQGHAAAQYNFGHLHYFGKGVPQDYSEALFWFRRSAEQGYLRAQYDLALSLANGEGVPQDYLTAHMWSNLAASSSAGDLNKKCGALRDWVAQQLSTDQLVEARRLATDWRPKS
jgi:TPR repeat protein